MESKSHTKYETEFFLKLYVDQKCCEANFKKTQNYEISDSLVFPSPSQGRQEDRVQGVHSVHQDQLQDPQGGSGRGRAFEELPSRLLSTSFVLSTSIDESLAVSFSSLSPSSSITSRLRERGNLGEHLLLHDISFVIHKMIKFHSNFMYIFVV